jgi:hypothetical protein
MLPDKAGNLGDRMMGEESAVLAKKLANWKMESLHPKFHLARSCKHKSLHGVSEEFSFGHFQWASEWSLILTVISSHDVISVVSMGHQHSRCS